MRARILGGALAVAGVIAACWWRFQASLPDVQTGVFPNGMEYMRSGTGSKTLLWMIGSPMRAVPPSRLVQRAFSLMYRPFLEAGYAVWTDGRRRTMPEGHTIPDMADDYARLIEDQFDGIVDVVVGESFGGMIGQYLAARHPDRFGHLVLIIAGCELDARSEEIDHRFIAALRAGDTAAARAISLEYLMPESKESTRRVLGSLMWRLLGLNGVPVGDLIIETEAGIQFDSRAVLPGITAPVLLIAGDRDRFFPRTVIEETAALIPNCTLILHQNQGHMDVANDPRTAREVLHHISTQRQRLERVPDAGARARFGDPRAVLVRPRTDRDRDPGESRSRTRAGTLG